jgi:hypothetical protein
MGATAGADADADTVPRPKLYRNVMLKLSSSIQSNRL